jgi:hypothetical protein
MFLLPLSLSSSRPFLNALPRTDDVKPVITDSLLIDTRMQVCGHSFQRLGTCPAVRQNYSSTGVSAGECTHLHAGCCV